MNKTETLKFLAENNITVAQLYDGNINDSFDLLLNLLEKLGISEKDIEPEEVEEDDEYMKANDYDRF